MTDTDDWLEVVDNEVTTTWRQDREQYTDAMEFLIKWDGCADLSESAADPANGQYMHLCDFDDFVDMLIEMREHMRRRFHEKHPDVWKTPGTVVKPR